MTEGTPWHQKQLTFIYVLVAKPRGVCSLEDLFRSLLQFLFASIQVCTVYNGTVDTCMSKWSGALTCPDATGRYYAVGLYYSEEVLKTSY